MKTIKNILVNLAFLLSLSGAVFAQDTKDKEAKSVSIKNMIDTKNFVFVPQTVLPLRGNTRTLTSYYDIRISGDSIISYLPYFGQAYSAPLDPANSGLDFTSTKFTYTVTPAKKGWDVIIKLQDKMDVSELSFRIFDNGSASLNVTNINRDAISFEGNIKKSKGK